MVNKILLQDLFAGVSLRSGSSKKDSENFVRIFFEMIEQYLLQDKIVKIKGLGTFKIVEVSGRDSVDVNTGERIHIKGHSKMTFTPDSSIRDHVNRPFADFETVILNEGVDLAAMEYVDDATEEENTDDYNVDAEIDLLDESEKSDPKDNRIIDQPFNGVEAENIRENEPTEMVSEAPMPTEEAVSVEPLPTEEAVSEEPLPTEETVSEEPLPTEEAVNEEVRPSTIAENIQQENVSQTEIQEEAEETVIETVNNTESNVGGENMNTKESEKRNMEGHFVCPHYIGNQTTDKMDNNEEPEGGHFLNYALKYLFCLLMTLLLLGLGYLAGSHHILGDGCEKRINEFLQSQSDEQIRSGENSENASNQFVDSDKETGSESADKAKEHKETPETSHNNETAKSNANGTAAANQAQSVNAAQAKNSGQTGSGNNANTQTSNKQAAGNNGDPSLYPQVQGGQYLITGVAQVHNIKPGESVNALAKKYLGDMDMAVYIIKLNNLNNPDIVEIGQKIKIPQLKKK